MKVEKISEEEFIDFISRIQPMYRLFNNSFRPFGIVLIIDNFILSEKFTKLLDGLHTILNTNSSFDLRWITKLVDLKNIPSDTIDRELLLLNEKIKVVYRIGPGR